MFRRVWPHSVKCTSWLRIHAYSTISKTPLAIERTNDVGNSVKKDTIYKETSATMSSGESSTVPRIKTALKQEGYVFTEGLDYWERYEELRQKNPSAITADDYIKTSLFVQRKSRSHTLLVFRLQSILRDVNTQMQSNPKLQGSFLKICNMLMYTYIRNNRLRDAKSVFDGLLGTGIWKDYPEIHVVSVTTLLNGIRELGTRADVHTTMNKLNESKQMPNNERIYVTAIYALSSFGDIKGCERLYLEMKKKGLAMEEPSFRAMVSVYSGKNNSEGILEILNEMKEKQLKPSVATYAMALKTLNGGNYAKEREEVYQSLLNSGEDLNVSVFLAMGLNSVQGLNTLIEMNRIPSTRDYNAALSHLLRNNQAEDAIEMYQGMIERGAEKDQYTYGIIMDAMLKAKGQLASTVFDLYEEMKLQDIKPDNAIYTSLLSACTKEKNIQMAISYLQEMSNFNIRPNLINCNAFLSVLAVSNDKSYKIRTIRDIWIQMRRWGIQADTRSYNIYFSACSNTMQQLRNQGKAFYDEPEEDELGQPKMGPCRYMLMSYRAMKEENNPLAQPDFATYTILVKTFSAFGFIRLAMQIYEDSKVSRIKLDVSVYNEIMKGLEKGGKMSDIMSIWYDMKMHGVLPDNKSYEIVLEACEKLGLNESL